MSQDSNTPTAGMRCLASPEGYWQPGHIHRVNEDGTFTIEFDTKQLVLMRHWYGVTWDQISINDESYWPEVFDRLTAGHSQMTQALYTDALRKLGYRIDDDGFREFWGTKCEELFGITGDPTDTSLDRDQSYQLLLATGCCAKRLSQPDRTEPHYYKMYWNQTRMAGRQPSDIKRSVTVDDAFQALGMVKQTVDEALVAQIVAFEKANDVELPENLYRLLSSTGIENAVVESHPNNPELVLPGSRDCELLRHPVLEDAKADYALRIMLPHSGTHSWFAIFDRGDSDATIYLQWDDDWMLTAPSVGFFFWDMAQTGLIWYQNTGYDGGLPIRSTDIGVAPAVR